MPVLRPRELGRLPWLEAGTTTRRAFPDRRGKPELARALPALLGGPDWVVQQAEQVHRAEIARVDDEAGPMLAPGADGLWTDAAGQLLAIFTADCLPLLLVDVEQRRLALLHAGRQSTEEGIGPRAVEGMLAAGSRLADLRAWIGPGVCADHYEVSGEIAGRFARRFPDWPEILGGPEGRHLDLRLLNRLQLARAGLERDHIETCALCSVEEKTMLHSYRRDGAAAGRMLTFAGIRPGAS